MAIRTIRTDEDPVLRKQSRVIDTVDAKLQGLIEDMIETMYDADGSHFNKAARFKETSEAMRKSGLNHNYYTTVGCVAAHLGDIHLNVQFLNIICSMLKDDGFNYSNNHYFAARILTGKNAMPLLMYEKKEDSSQTGICNRAGSAIINYFSS